MLDHPYFIIGLRAYGLALTIKAATLGGMRGEEGARLDGLWQCGTVR